MFRKNQTAKTQHPESAFASLFDDDVARVAISEEGRIVYASESFCDLSHIGPMQFQEIEAATILDFARHDGTLEDLAAGVHSVRINGNKEFYNFHFDWLTAPDKKRYLVGSEALQPGKDTAANARPEDLQSFLDMSGDIMIVMDDRGGIARVNKVFHDLFGTTIKDLADTDYIDLFEESEKLYIRNTIRSLSFSDEDACSLDFEAQVKTQDGSPRWISWRQCRKGEMIYCIGRDITNIKSQKTALDRREKQLSQAESIGRMGHWHWTIGEHSFEWSEEIYRIFGVARGTFEPTLENMNRMVNRSDIARVDHAFQRAIIEQNDYDMEFRVKRPDGETRFIRCEGRCALNAEGEVVALYGIMQDMTERMQNEHQLRQAKDIAERAYASKSQFLANMSHELRTPLNAIIGFSEMMQRQLLGPIGTAKYLDYIGGIRESGEHLLDLISDILDMSKIEAGKYELMLEELNVTKTIRMATHMMEGRALEADVKISTDALKNDTLMIVADRRAFMQIMLNLLSNAVKFTKEKGQVSVECHEREDYIALKVIDNGIGIPANKLSQITRPFEQVSSSYTREHEGSGLGLAITKELAEMHGGALNIESTLGKGTTVTVRLPYKALEKQKNTQ
jgi:two-component system, cell cycle sensor histidine kinase PleC